MNTTQNNLHKQYFEAFDRLAETEKRDEIKKLMAEIRVLNQSILDRLDKMENQA